jgi:hypothetical protein
MAIHIRRREFVVALGSAATWPLAALQALMNGPIVKSLLCDAGRMFSRGSGFPVLVRNCRAIPFGKCLLLMDEQTPRRHS